MLSHRRLLVLSAMIAVALAIPAGASAQTDEEHFLTFSFNFSNPGARAAALGGAFLGLADDASAAITNPAGLSLVTRRQVYAEFKNFTAKTAKLGGFDSLLTGEGALSGRNLSIPGFFNIAIPINEKLVLAGSYHRFLDYRDDFDLGIGTGRRALSSPVPVLPAVSTSVDFGGESYVGSGSFVVSPKLQVGMSVAVSRLSGKAHAQRTPTVVGATLVGIVPSTEMAKQSKLGAGASAGLLYQPARSFTVGLVGTLAPRFRLRQRVIYTDPTKFSAAFAPQVAAANASYAATMGGADTLDVRFNVPSRVGVGVVWAPDAEQRYRVLFDAVHVFYSALAKDVQPFLFRDYGSVVSAARVAEPAGLDRAKFSIDNGTEYRFGTEVKVRRGSTPVFLRYGAFLLPSHNLRYTVSENKSDPNVWIKEDQILEGKDVGDVFYPRQIISQVYFLTATAAVGPRGSKDRVVLGRRELGWSVGGGINVRSNVQFDVAYQQSSHQRKEFVVSAKYQFQ